MRPLLIAVFLLVISAPTVGQAWEQSLLAHKRNGTLAGPRPGQKCLWSERLHGCPGYTPGRWNLYLRD